MGADVGGFGGAEFFVQREGVLPVFAGLVGVAEVVVGVAEAGAGAGLLVAIADAGGR